MSDEENAEARILRRKLERAREENRILKRRLYLLSKAKKKESE